MAQFGVNRVYQDFEPFFEWNEDTVSVTLTIMLPGFRRDQLKVQVTSAPLLRINGEREVTLNIWRRFSKEFSIPTYCDTNEVTAKFERGMLHVKFPKIVNPNPNPNPQQQEQSKTEQQQQQQQQRGGGENVAPPPIPQQSQEVNSNNNDQQNSQQKEKEKEKEKEREEPVSEEKTEKKTEAEHKNDELPKTGEENEATKEVDKERNESEKVKGKETEPENGIAESKKVGERKRGSRIAQRLKTRVLDFSLSVNDDDDDDVRKGYFSNLVRGVKKPKMMVNLVVAILLLVMVFGTYLLKNSLWSSSESEGGSSEFKEF